MSASFLITLTIVGVTRKLTKTNNNSCAIIFIVCKNRIYEIKSMRFI